MSTSGLSLFNMGTLSLYYGTGVSMGSTLLGQALQQQQSTGVAQQTSTGALALQSASPISASVSGSASGLYNALSSYYSSGVSMGTSLLGEVLSQQSGAPSTSSSPAAGGNLATGTAAPPWTQSSPPALTADTVFQNGSQPLITAPPPGQSGATGDINNLFALYGGLTKLQQLAQYASTDPNYDPLRGLINQQFQTQLGQYYAFFNSAQFSTVNVIPGIANASVTSSVTQPTAPTSYVGGIVSSDPTQAVAGLNTSQAFTIAVKNGATTTNVTINLSQVSGTLSLNNVVKYINAQLAAAGVATVFSVDQTSATQYGIQVTPGTNETVSLSPTGSASSQPAVYLTSTAGGGPDSYGMLRKFDGLSNAAPTQDFQNNINADPAPVTTSGSTSSTSTYDPSTQALATATDANGNSYVVGTTDGNLAGQTNNGSQDVYLQKFDATGKLVWSQLLGATGTASGYGVTVDSSGNVIVTGNTTQPLNPDSISSSSSAFVTKFDSTGQQIFTYQLPTASPTSGLAVTTDSSGNIFIAGQVNGTVDGSATSGGGTDAFLTKLSSTGTLDYSQQFGGSGNQTATGVAVDNSGHVYVLYNDQSTGTAHLAQFNDAAGSAMNYDTNLGTVGSGGATGLALDSSGNVYVTGSTSSGGMNGTVQTAYAGGTEAFLSQVNASTGAVNTVSYVAANGGSASAAASGIAINGSTVYLSGTTNGALSGGSFVGTAGNNDSFLATLNGTTGALTNAQQFGGAFSETGTGVALATTGTSVLTSLGLPNDTVPPTPSTSITSLSAARAGDTFQISVNGGVAQTITLGTTDTLGSLATAIDLVLGSNGTAQVVQSGNTSSLQIKATTGNKITFLAGSSGFDLLKPLGLSPGSILPPGNSHCSAMG